MISAKAQDKAQRILILGAGVLNGFRENSFRAVLAHEYGHFVHRDTAGGEVAMRVNNDMIKFANAMIMSGQAVWWNLAFQFLRLYHFIFRRIGHGASRLQEVMADRMAALNYGAESFEEGLRHVIRRSVEFQHMAHREIDEAVKSGRALQNLYDLSLEKESSVEEEINTALNRQTSEDDTHPSPMVRFRLVRQVRLQGSPSATGMVWNLFANREGLTNEMSGWVNEQVGKSVA
jgi:Zn-dependent protease with chaperone function